jgi:hypothetical protein
MPSPSAGIGAQRNARFVNSEAGQPMRNYYNTLTEHYKSKGKPSSAMPVVTHKFVGGNDAYSYTDALSALKRGEKIDSSGATKEEQAMLNTKYLQSLNRKPVNLSGNSSYVVTGSNMGDARISYSGLGGNKSTYTSIPVMR